MTRRVLAAWLLVAFAATTSVSRASAPVEYRVSIPEPEHHWLQVEMTLSEIDPGPLELVMSRSSPGRYAVHDFAKNVYDVAIEDGDGRPLAFERPDPSRWVVPRPGAAARVRYKVFGDVSDGTYLAVDETHAHINMPAALMWVRGWDDRPATIVFAPPAAEWQAATQLFPGASPFAFTAPNLPYLMDSPVELGPLAIREFTVDGRLFRLAIHHQGRDEGAMDRLARDAARIVAEERAVFGELPAFESGRYTFLGDFLPEARSDGMEHRNSAVMTASATLERNHGDILDTIAHEFFHAWNVERIRPRSLEPFALDRANPSPDLWLAEGFTQYYGYLALSRTGLVGFGDTVFALSGLVSSLTATGRPVRSVEESSRFAVFMDGAAPVDRTNWSDTVVSYYLHGGALALALDLSLRERTAGRVTLDDFMRAMWEVHGRAGGTRPGYVDRPYTSEDAEARLAEVSGDAAFARDFFARYVHGRDVADYRRLLAQAGLRAAGRAQGDAWWGQVALEVRGGKVIVTSAPSMGSPAHAAGLDAGAQLVALDGRRIQDQDDVSAVLRRHRPGEVVALSFVTRGGAARTSRVTLGEDPALVISPLESSGGTLTEAQRAFRARWLGPRS